LGNSSNQRPKMIESGRLLTLNPSDSERCALSQHYLETAELISCHLSKKLVGRGCDTSLREFKINAAVLILVAGPDSISLYSIA
jgi:hypothetical protein